MAKAKLIQTVKVDPKKVKEKGLGIFGEFKDFISKGNVLDLAVGVVIGAAFGKIVSSLVDDIIMPLVGMIIGGINFSHLSVKVGDAVITYGNFINNVVDFLIVAFCIFIVVKIFNKMNRKKKEEVKVEAPKVSREEELLSEILKEIKKKK